MTEQKLRISAFVITLNEEKNIANCLKSLDFCEEIIVIDSGSTDRTVFLAEQLGAKVVFNKFTGYRDQKQFGLEQCTQDWVISLDADERVSENLKNYLINYFNNKNNNNLKISEEFDGFEIKRLNIFWGKALKHGDYYPDYKLRIFKREKAKFTGLNTHERVELTSNNLSNNLNNKIKIKKLNCDLIHYSWLDLKNFAEAQLRYSHKIALDKASLGIKINIIYDFLLRPVLNFIHKYFIKLGFLDGYAGFMLAFLNSCFSAYKYFVIFETQRAQREKEKIFPLNFWRNNIFNLILGLIYGLISELRVYLYKNNFLLKVKKLDIPVISIGNISAGGSGKTPFVLWLVEKLNQENIFKNICILTRGYKRKIKKNNKQEILQVTENIPQEEAGDEAFMLHEKLNLKLKNNNLNNNNLIVISPDRYSGGLYAQEKLNSDLIVLDDGFQHIKLHRDLNICLLDCSDINIFKILPEGNLRENFRNINRADLVILTRHKVFEFNTQKILKLLAKYKISQEKILYLDEKIINFSQVFDNPNNLNNLNSNNLNLKDKKLFVFCGIANPVQFLSSLENSEYIQQKINNYLFFPDHRDYNIQDLLKINNSAELAEADYIITTHKDSVKLKNIINKNNNYLLELNLNKFLVAHLEITGLENFSARFSDLLNNIKN